MDPGVRFASLSGLAFVVLFGIGSGLWAFDQPPRDAESAEILAFFEGTSNWILVGGTMSLVSLGLLVWFGTSVSDRLIAAEGATRTGLPSLAYAGIVLTAAVGFAAETINMAAALAAKDGQLTGAAAQIYFDLSYAFGAHAASVTFALVILPVGMVSLRTGQLMSRSAAWSATLLGAALLTPIILIRPAFFILYSLILLTFATLSLRLFREA